jgi:hypothetical protein
VQKLLHLRACGAEPSTAQTNKTCFFLFTKRTFPFPSHAGNKYFFAITASTVYFGSTKLPSRIKKPLKQLELPEGQFAVLDIMAS